MAVIGFLVFASALAASIAVFWLTLAPAVPRIVALLRDGVDPAVPLRRIHHVSEARVRQRVRTAPFVVQPAWRAAA